VPYCLLRGHIASTSTAQVNTASTSTFNNNVFEDFQQNMQNFLEGKFNELSSQRQKDKRIFQNQMNQKLRESKGHDFKYKSNKLQK